MQPSTSLTCGRPGECHARPDDDPDHCIFWFLSWLTSRACHLRGVCTVNCSTVDGDLTDQCDTPTPPWQQQIVHQLGEVTGFCGEITVQCRILTGHCWFVHFGITVQCRILTGHCWFVHFGYSCAGALRFSTALDWRKLNKVFFMLGKISALWQTEVEQVCGEQPFWWLKWERSGSWEDWPGVWRYDWLERLHWCLAVMEAGWTSVWTLDLTFWNELKRQWMFCDLTVMRKRKTATVEMLGMWWLKSWRYSLTKKV